MKELKMFINGKFVTSRSGKWIDVLNPSTEEVISRQPEGTIEDVNEALDAARAAQKAWAKTPSIERAAYLKKLANGIRARREELLSDPTYIHDVLAEGNARANEIANETLDQVRKAMGMVY